MPTIQQLTFIEPGRLEWQEIAAPTLEDDRQALVRPLAVTRCDLDLYIANGLYPMEGPFAFGHEIAAEVVDVGDAVVSVGPGDRVVVPFQINCGDCGPCCRGHTNACTSVAPFSAYGLAPIAGVEWGGGLSDLLRVPFADAMLMVIPAAVSVSAAAALADNASDGFRTVCDALDERPGADVLVVGGLAQSVGLYAVQAAVALGAGRVVYRDFDADRLRAARDLGAEAIEIDYGPALRAREQFPIVVEAGGLPEALEFAIRSTEPCGLCTGVSAGTVTSATVPLRAMYTKGITYSVGRVHARATLDRSLDCACAGHIDPDRLITDRVPFSAAAEAMSEPGIKPVFVREP